MKASGSSARNERSERGLPFSEPGIGFPAKRCTIEGGEDCIFSTRIFAVLD